MVSEARCGASQPASFEVVALVLIEGQEFAGPPKLSVPERRRQPWAVGIVYFEGQKDHGSRAVPKKIAHHRGRRGVRRREGLSVRPSPIIHRSLRQANPAPAREPIQDAVDARQARQVVDAVGEVF